MKNSKYKYFKHPARYVNQFTGVKGWVWVMGDVKEIVHNHRGSLQQRNLVLDLSQPRLGNYALVDLPNPVFPFSGVSNNLSLTSWLKFFFLILQYFSLYAKALCCLFRNFECKINLFISVCSECFHMYAVKQVRWAGRLFSQFSALYLPEYTRDNTSFVFISPSLIFNPNVWKGHSGILTAL